MLLELVAVQLAKVQAASEASDATRYRPPPPASPKLVAVLGFVVRAGSVDDEERIADMTAMIYTITAISYAGSGDAVRLKALMETDPDWNASSCDYDFRTPLHLAACAGSKAAVELLEEHGVCLSLPATLNPFRQPMERSVTASSRSSVTCNL